MPSIVSISEPTDDTFIDGVTGINVRPSHPEDIVSAVDRMINDTSMLEAMGKAASALARENFKIESNLRKLISCYSRLLGR